MAKLNMSDQTNVELYVQQVMTKGNIEDVQKLLADIGEEKTGQIFLRLKNFFPSGVRRFWEDFFGYSH